MDIDVVFSPMKIEEFLGARRKMIAVTDLGSKRKVRKVGATGKPCR
jgi:hypothetical protein